MRLTTLVSACIFCLFAAACTPSADIPGTVLVPRTSNVTLVEISPTGVGGITGDTRYGAKSVEAALPGFTTEGIQTAVENNTEWALAAFNSDGFQVLQVFKGKDGNIRTVHGVTHHLRGPNGERIGMKFTEAGVGRRDCRAGQNLWRGMAICKAKNAPNIELVFSIPQFTGPFDKLAPDAELRSAELQRILWTPTT